MLSNENTWLAAAWNLGLILAWDLIVFCCCRALNDNHFDYNKYIYREKYWENNGKWYNKWIKIKSWKNFLPQYISKNGFSKKSLTSLSLTYIDRFILETCRAEWAHKNCMWVAVLIVLINKILMGITFCTVVLLINLPYVCIQRYNRIRLINLREKIVKSRRSEFENENVMDFVKKIELANFR